MKTSTIIIIAVVLATLAALAYYFFSKKENAANGFVNSFFGGETITGTGSLDSRLDLGLADTRLTVSGYNANRADIYDSFVNYKANRTPETNTNRLGLS